MTKLAALAVVVIALALGLGAYLIRANQLTAQQLCQALARMVATSAPAPGTADYRYYKAHPAKLAVARQKFLDQLPCRPPAGVASTP